MWASLWVHIWVLVGFSLLFGTCGSMWVHVGPCGLLAVSSPVANLCVCRRSENGAVPTKRCGNINARLVLGSILLSIEFLFDEPPLPSRPPRMVQAPRHACCRARPDVANPDFAIDPHLRSSTTNPETDFGHDGGLPLSPRRREKVGPPQQQQQLAPGVLSGQCGLRTGPGSD